MRFRIRALAAVLTAAFIPLASPAQTTVTMDGVLSAPFIADLETSPDGGTIAYIVHERGTHAIYSMRLGERARRVVWYAKDTGHSIGWLQVARGGGAVAYVRGGGPNREGEIANPTSELVAPKEQIWIANLSGGAPMLVGDGSGPLFSPDAKQLMWMAHGAIMLTPLTWKNGNVKVGRFRRPFEIRGTVREPRFSPDGTKIAFESQRGDHSFVTIFDTVARKLTYASPSFRSDISPAWSPDGRSIAFLRLPAPFSIWVANATTGVARRIWQADAGMGSDFYGLDSSNQLLWSKDGRIAFAWEKNGWRNLWTVPAAGGVAVDVTPGQFEVQSALTSLDRSQLVYATNEGDIDRRHIWTVGFNAANPTALTRGSESQWFPTPLAGGGLAYVNAGWGDAPQVMVRTTRAAAVAVGPQIPASFPAAAMVEPKLVTFTAADGLLIHGQLFVPADGTAKHCGVIFVHGGSERQMLPGFHYMEAYANLYETNQYIVNHGCEVLSVNYRSGIMYGHAFRTAAGVGPRGASEYQDVIAGARFLQARPEVDPDRIGIYGLSYGGYETAMALARNSDIFKAGFDMAGVHDWATINGGSGRGMGTSGEHGTAYDSSPVASISTWKSPVFLAQGDDDRNVPFSQGVEMDRALRAQGVDVTDMVFPNETHEMTLVYADEVRLYSAGIGFLLGHLGGTP
jgi:dipeptidyl aminopeptidase/acylaminoacyl peptidase